jgi:TetR/AcrR family transcriptional regulator
MSRPALHAPARPGRRPRPAARPRAAPRPRPPHAAPVPVRSASRRARAPRPEAPGTRARLFAAAAAEFAARGFAGGSVDRIARAARVNKAMIYYHFGSKAALYREILADMFRAVGARVRAAAYADVAPEEKIRRFIAAIAAEADARPHFPPIWFREVAEGGSHLDDATLGDILAIVRLLGAIIEEGRAARRFRDVSPLLVHGGIVGPLLLFLASAGLRRRLDRAGLGGASGFTPDEVVAHVQRVTLGTLQGRFT